MKYLFTTMIRQGKFRPGNMYIYGDCKDFPWRHSSFYASNYGRE